MATVKWCPIFPKWDNYQPLNYQRVITHFGYGHGSWQVFSLCLQRFWSGRKGHNFRCLGVSAHVRGGWCQGDSSTRSYTRFGDTVSVYICINVYYKYIHRVCYIRRVMMINVPILIYKRLPIYLHPTLTKMATPTTKRSLHSTHKMWTETHAGAKHQRWFFFINTSLEFSNRHNITMENHHFIAG